MKNAANIFITIVACISLLVLWKIFAKVTGLFISTNQQVFYQFVQAGIIIFCLLGGTYKKLWSPNVLKHWVTGIAFSSIAILMLILCYHFLSIHKRAIEYYNYITSNNFISWGPSMYTKDDNLGYRMIPASQTSLLYHYLPPVDVKTDTNGYRIPVSKKNLTDVTKPVDILFLGCSFTFGSACRAEDTFPYIVAVEMRKNYVNAAVGGYGLAQMYLQAKQLISKYKPKYLVIQNSPWLILRGVSEFAPSRGGYMLPVPYFADSGKLFQVEKPIYKSSIGKLFPAKDRRLFSGKILRYYFRRGVPYFAQEQFYIFITRCKNLVSLKQTPTTRIDSAEFDAYRKIFEYAELNQTKVILLKLGNSEGSNKTELISKLGRNISVANADSLLYGYINGYSSNKYRTSFGHWGTTERGDSIFVDGHPNNVSHKLIAQSIFPHLMQ